MEKKARFIAQLKTGNIDTRTAEDVGGGMENAAAAAKAVSTGDPRYVEQVQLADDVARLAAMQRAHSDSKGRNASDRRMLGQDVVAAGRQLSALDAVLPALEASKEAPFAMSIRGRTFTERAQAAPALAQSLRQAYSDGRGKGAQAVFVVASLRGVDVTAARLLQTDELMLELSIPGRDRRVKGDAYTGTAGGGVGLVTRVENMVKDTGNYRTECAQRHDHAQNRIAELEKVADAPFPQVDELRDKRRAGTPPASTSVTATSCGNGYKTPPGANMTRRSSRVGRGS